MIMALGYSRLTGCEQIKTALLSTVKTTAMLMWILVGAIAFGTVLAYCGATQNISNWVVGLPLSPLGIIIAINILLLVLGMVLETGAIMMVVWPLLINIAQAMGFDLIWFAVILVIQMELGQITPPVGIVLFAMKSIAPNISVAELFKGVIPFVIILALAIAIIIAFPQIATWLPSTMKSM